MYLLKVKHAKAIMALKVLCAAEFNIFTVISTFLHQIKTSLRVRLSFRCKNLDLETVQVVNVTLHILSRG